MKRTLLAIIATALAVAGPAYAQAKWWWESYPTQVDKPLQLKAASGGAVSTTRNPTSSNIATTGNAATQPPTVIIQQTASSQQPTLTCVQTTSPASGNIYGTTVTNCPAIHGFNVTPVIGGGFNSGNVSHYSNQTTLTVSPILACCYSSVASSAGNAPSYNPWVSNPAFVTNGYTGSQHQDFTTPGSYTFVVPTNVYKIWITAVGGGGSGWAGAWQVSDQYGGGAGGVAYRVPLDVLPGQTYDVVVGHGRSMAWSHGAPVAGDASYVRLAANPSYGVGAQGGGGGGSSAVGYQAIPGQCPPASTGCNNPSMWQGPMGAAGLLSGMAAPTGNNGRGGGPGSYGFGTSFNPSGGGRGSGGGGGCGGGGAGFIGMPWTSGAIPSGGGGPNSTGGFGYGAGGAGTCTANASGGRGADGAVWIEW